MIRDVKAKNTALLQDDRHVDSVKDLKVPWDKQESRPVNTQLFQKKSQVAHMRGLIRREKQMIEKPSRVSAIVANHAYSDSNHRALRGNYGIQNMAHHT